MKARPWNLARGLLLICFVTAFFLGLAGQVLATEHTALVTEIDGIINPVSQRHISRTIETAEKEQAQVVIILLDTPGGLLSSTRKTFESLLNAQVPTVVFVSPRGAQAASAGTFITAAAHLAVMAPGTSIGAATPVGSGGEDLPETLESKITNAAAADMRAIAEERERNVDALENTVLKAQSFSAEEAVDLRVVDFIAQDLEDLLAKLDGMSVTIEGRERVLATQDIQVKRLNMSLIDRFLFIIADPNISFILLSVGGLAIVVEIFNPGLIFPGLTGVIFLVMAFISLGNLPVNWAGAALILLAAGLIVAEFYVSGFGILGIGGIISLVLGALLLFAHFGSPSPTEPSLGVSLWILVPFATIVTVIGTWVLLTIVRQHKMERVLDLSPILGSVGTVTTDLNPRGTVQIGTEIWTAYTNYGTISRTGAKVRVVAVEGATVRVVPAEEPQTPAPLKQEK